MEDYDITSEDERDVAIQDYNYVKGLIVHDVSASDNMAWALSWHYRYHQQQLCSVIKDLKLNLNMQKDGSLLLTSVMRTRNLSFVKLLLDCGADMYAVDDCGSDVLGHALLYGSYNDIQYIIKCGFDVSRASTHSHVCRAVWLINGLDDYRIMTLRLLFEEANGMSQLFCKHAGRTPLGYANEIYPYDKNVHVYLKQWQFLSSLQILAIPRHFASGIKRRKGMWYGKGWELMKKMPIDMFRLVGDMLV